MEPTPTNAEGAHAIVPAEVSTLTTEVSTLINFTFVGVTFTCPADFIDKNKDQEVEAGIRDAVNQDPERFLQEHQKPLHDLSMEYFEKADLSMDSKKAVETEINEMEQRHMREREDLDARQATERASAQERLSRASTVHDEHLQVVFGAAKFSKYGKGFVMERERRSTT